VLRFFRRPKAWPEFLCLKDGLRAIGILRRRDVGSLAMGRDSMGKGSAHHIIICWDCKR